MDRHALAYAAVLPYMLCLLSCVCYQACCACWPAQVVIDCAGFEATMRVSTLLESWPGFFCVANARDYVWALQYDNTELPLVRLAVRWVYSKALQLPQDPTGRQAAIPWGSAESLSPPLKSAGS